MKSSRVKKKGGVVEYVVFDNEGHGFTKKANEIRGYKAILVFLDKYLKGSDAGKLVSFLRALRFFASLRET